MQYTKRPVAIRTNLYITRTIHFSYPSVVGFDNSIAQRNINKTIFQLMNKIIKELQQPNIITYIKGWYEIKTNERNVLSLALNGFAEFGGAHPISLIYSLNFDILTGKNYLLSQQFKENSGYIEKINEIIKKELELRKIPTYEPFNSITPDQTYYIADMSIIIYFQYYEIGPRQAGTPYFVIPNYEYNNMLVADGLLARLSWF